MKDLHVLAAEDFNALETIGLTKIQARCYGLLNAVSGLSAGELAKRLEVNRPNMYPILKDLQEKGFIISFQITRPTTYRFVPLTQALVVYAEYQRRQVRDLIALQQAA
jgi:sugar-specific transcriptional regulator TrmB